ncbi:hypothetical protein PhCBS80983_g03781 [Powellomyces hirtus]|uniref:Uncharacterized protein n=1 Tax=Powellomyces hirtus TaxID=109895 RepID=A0A507E2I5_9FUNG|nr:hypothetical protein PhCBS80983_g03781 [Powellomyces hirtus]
MSDPESVLEKLKVALDLVETLRTENDAYKGNFDVVSTFPLSIITHVLGLKFCARQLKSTHERLQERHSNLVDEFEISQKEKLAVEAQNSELTAHFKSQLDAKTKELEVLRTKIPNPKDMEILRLKTVQEVEEQNEKRWKSMNKDTEKYRNLYYTLRRDYELAKTDIDRERSQTNAKLREMELSYQEELNALENRMLELRQCLETSTDPQRLRELQRDNADLQLRVSSMLPELEELRAEKEKLHIDNEQLSRLSKRRLLDEISHSKSLQAEKDALAVKLATIEAESAQTLRSLDQATENNVDLTKELDRARSRLDEVSHQFKVETNDTKLVTLKRQTQYENTIGELKEKVNVLESQLKTATEIIHSLRDRIAANEKDAMEKCRQAREEEWGARTQLESDKSHLETQLSNLKHTLFENENTQDTVKRELQTELGTLKRSLRDSQSQNEAMSKTALDTTTELERLRALVTQLEQTVNEAETRATGLVKDLETRSRESQSLRADIAKNEADLQAVRTQLARTSEKLEQDSTAYQFETERIKGLTAYLNQASWSKEKSVIMQTLEVACKDKEQWAEKTQELEDLLSKSQELFKSKVKLVRTRAREYKDEINRLRKSLDAQTKRADAVAREIHQRQTDFLGLLSTEGIVEATA